MKFADVPHHPLQAVSNDTQMMIVSCVKTETLARLTHQPRFVRGATTGLRFTATSQVKFNAPNTKLAGSANSHECQRGP